MNIHSIDAPALAPEGSILLVVQGIKNNQGVIRAALFHATSVFPSDKPFRGFELSIMNGRASLELTKIPVGEYAFAVFHDENNDGKLNQNLLGIPTEAYGFSNNARSLFGPPSFDQAKFTVGTGTITITIDVK